MIRSVFVLFFVATTLALAVGAGEPLRISSYTIDGGGVMRSTSADNQFVMSGTIGQPDAGPDESGMSGGDFRLTGGFWFETPPGDCNGNGVRDLAYHKEFADCMTGPGKDAGGSCLCFGITGDGRSVDLFDFAEIQRLFFAE